jgi:hypothetical protein
MAAHDLTVTQLESSTLPVPTFLSFRYSNVRANSFWFPSGAW